MVKENILQTFLQTSYSKTFHIAVSILVHTSQEGLLVKKNEEATMLIAKLKAINCNHDVN